MKKILLSFLFLTVATPAMAEKCTVKEKAEGILQLQKMVRVGHSLNTDGDLVEFYINPVKNWAIVRRSPTGLTCLVHSGENWDSLSIVSPFVTPEKS